MHSRDGEGPGNLPFERVSRVAAANDGTLNAIVNKSVCSVDAPLGIAASRHEDAMLSWLHYPVVDSLDRGYCSDIFGDLPISSGHLVRHPFNVLGLRPQDAPLNTGKSTFSGILSHEKQGASSIDTCTVGPESVREVVESCGCGPVEASFRVAGADAVLGLGACQATGLTSLHVGLEVYGKVGSEGKVLRRVENVEKATCEGLSANETLYAQTESSQILNQVASQQGSFSNMSTLSCVPKPLDVVNCYMPPVAVGKHISTNFALFSRPSVDLKASLHVAGESNGLTNIERVRQQTGQHGLFQESTSTGNLGAVDAKWLPSPPPLPPMVPLALPPPPLLPPSCSSVALERSPIMYGSRSSLLPLPPSSVNESRGETNLSTDTVKTTDQIATSPSRFSGSSTERSGKVTDSSIKQKLSAGDDSDYQSEHVEEMIATEKNSPSNCKRMRTAAMHNQSERKRRVKINDKLKTLQQLVPNGNKPDKASLLDAVIEYIKLLQSQLQVISMRTGMGIPSWSIPNVNMQHLQLPAFTQMRLTTDMGMGVGIGVPMRMGLGMMDANVGAVGTGCTIMPTPLFPMPQSSYSDALQPADRVQSPGAMNLHNFYAGPSHVQHPIMNQIVPMYNALQPQLQPCVQLQQQNFQMKSPQLPPGSAGKSSFS